MIGRAEIERAIVGSWRLFTGKGDALTYFDTSRDGFWRSFQVVALVAPARTQRATTGNDSSEAAASPVPRS